MDNQLFIDTTLLFISLMLTVIFSLAWKTMERTPHALTWALSFFFFALRIVAGFFTNHLPPPIAISLVASLTLISLGLGIYGWRQRGKLNTNLYRFIGYFTAYLIVIIVSVTVFPHAGIAYAAIPICAATVFIMDSVIICRVKRPLRISERSIIVVYVSFALIELVAATVALMQGTEYDAYYHGLYAKINFFFMPAAFMGMGLFATLILVDDLAQKMKNLAMTDALTGLINRRGFEEALSLILALNKRSNEKVYIVLADLDYFKRINDSYGHASGDIALKEFADILIKNVRTGDIAARIGGEEFALLLPSTDEQTALKIVERIRSTTSSREMISGKYRFGVTASFGLAILDHTHSSFEDVFSEADKALYRAKSEGRNRVACS